MSWGEREVSLLWMLLSRVHSRTGLESGTREGLGWDGKEGKGREGFLLLIILGWPKGGKYGDGDGETL